MDFNFVCPTEITAFGERIEDFPRDIDAEILGVSTTRRRFLDRPRADKKTRLGGESIRLVADQTSKSLATMTF